MAELKKERFVQGSYDKLMALKNDKLHAFIADAIDLCNPDSVFVCSDDAADIAYVRKQAVALGEEKPLTTEGHTYHFDGYHDQGRDKGSTKYLVPAGVDLGKRLSTMEKNAGIAEVRDFMKNVMQGRQMIVRFFCLGPTRSVFSISGVQITDSFYVAHSEDLLYRAGYEQFKRLGASNDFFRVLHSCGAVDAQMISTEPDKRRVYIVLDEEMVYSVNTQYAGNTVGFKKLALRFAICKADREKWLAEHMFVMAVNGPGGRSTYFTGAFPSACGKTSTAMLPGERIIGDDIAYFRNIDGALRAVNVECGIFGIIGDVNPKDDPVIYNVLTSPGQVIFSNVLIKDKKPYWLGMGSPLPDTGYNHAGEWTKGMIDAEGAEVTASHKNARYTISLRALANLDSQLDEPQGVPVSGVIFGGRDSDTSVPVQESYSWDHGVLTMGASLESETTAATLGKEGVRSFNPMSNLDFVSIPLGRYIQNYLDFGAKLSNKPAIFAVNYFLKNKDGKYLNGMTDKRVWVKWMELRVHGEVEAIDTPTGRIPKFADLQRLFKDVLGKEYTEANYVEQFSIRVPELLKKIDRIEKIYRTDVSDTPAVMFAAIEEQRRRLLDLQAKHGDLVSPLVLGK